MVPGYNPASNGCGSQNLGFGAKNRDSSSRFSIGELIFEDNKNEKYSEFNLNLLSLDSEQLAVPDTEYGSVVTMSSYEFARICKEMSQISETVNIETNKEHIRFSVTGEIAGGSVTLNL